MELFSEIYSCYYQVLRHILCRQDAMTMQDIRSQICKEGFGESMLSIIPRLKDGTWNLLDRNGELFLSRLSPSFLTPLSSLEKSYLKALLSDPRIGLFLEKEQLDTLGKMLADVKPLWRQEQFYYYDRFSDGDPYRECLQRETDPASGGGIHTDISQDNYERFRHNFRILLQAQKKQQYVDLDYTSPAGTRVHHYYVPARIEYSVKNDRFRLLALKNAGNGSLRLEILNVARIQNVSLTDRYLSCEADLNTLIRSSYYKEPVKLRIVNERNALERAMLHFANYEKDTKRTGANTYECCIYYNQSMETELLIEVMSFGPVLRVLGNERFLNALRSRLKRQRELLLTDSPLCENMM